MSEIATVERTPLLPLPTLPIHIRPATMEDIPFVDGLQKKHGKALGFFPRAQMEGYVRNGWMLVAEEGQEGVDSRESMMNRDAKAPALSTINYPLPTPRPLGFIASRDRYLKRDELGAVYQLCVEPGRQRGLIGATLLKSAFDRAAYGCKLFCCWCAQDLPANRFWEAMGFVPIAFRTGGGAKAVSGRVGESERREGHSTRRLTASPSHRGPRVHIFWQKRIRSGDVSTPWWFPSKTEGGSIREDRIVLPIPPGVRWSDEMPRILPGVEGEEVESEELQRRALSGPRARKAKVALSGPVKHGPRQFGGPPAVGASAPVAAIEKPPREKKQKVKADPKMVSAARELRDRYLDEVNAHPTEAIPGKYDVARALEAKPARAIGATAPRAIEGTDRRPAMLESTFQAAPARTRAA